MCPYFSCIVRIASSESTRSSSVSPMPIRMPVVNAIARFPASSIVRNRNEGTLSGAFACGKPSRISRKLTFSSINPTLAFDSFSLSSTAPSITPGFACGSSPVRSSTNSHIAAK